MSTSAGGGRFRVTRIQTNFVARRERALLTWLCPRLPAWATPDGLTGLGIAGAALVLAAGLASRWSPWFLWLAAAGLVVNWFGDSLDGSLARFRGTERPLYGYFLDHTVDAFNNLLIMLGFGAMPALRMDVALYGLVAYYLLCIYVFINNHVRGVMQLSMAGMGPTELRLFLAAICAWMFFAGASAIAVAGTVVSRYDLLVLFGATIMVAIFLANVAAGVVALRRAA